PPAAAAAQPETAEALKPTLAPEPAATQVPSLDEPDEAAPKAQSKPDKPQEAKPEKQQDAQKPPLPAKADAQPKKTPEKPPEKPVEPKPSQPPQAQPKPRSPPPQQQVAKLDLSPPTAAPVVTFNAAIGTGTGSIARPAGITRSGLNDEFARKVVAALQKTMPQINTRGTLVVEIRLDMNGNLVTTIVRQPSNIAGLDGSVVFATKQTSFPIPFTTAKPDDLIFFVRYIYR
ncbi:MAG: hypothetical protein K2Y05_07765, partial [Hyphomicrobiaceae bacterium]|nr:hypothetical protein [Hyphomicrobiaceae bacterium]